VTSSMGLLIDGMAALLELCPINRHQDEAARRLEAAARRHRCAVPPYPFILEEPVLDWSPMILALLREKAEGAPLPHIAARIHATLAAMVVKLARRGRRGRVVLGGDCFQNRLLTRRAIEELKHAGFTPFVGRRIPPNDGGLSVGQVAAVSVYRWS